MSAEAQLAQLGLTLPPAPKPVATYTTAVQYSDLLYLSGHGPLNPDGSMHTGRLGENLSVEQGQAAARQTGLAILATLRDRLGSLDKIKKLIKVLGLVNSTDGFHDQPRVMNGFSDLMVEVFGEEIGKGARSAIGTNTLPGGIAVEIEAIFQIDA